MPNAADRRARAARRGDRPRRGRPVHREPLVRVGPVPERARLGHRARGLLATTATPGTPSRTTTPARARTAGTRTAWPASPTSATSSASRSRCGTGSDPILKERMFGLTGPQGNHGEDVKEYWWYLEGLPSHALLQLALPLPAGARSPTSSSSQHGRGLHDPELELLDTGVFDDDRYWSVDVTYAKASPTEVLMRIERREPRAGRGDARRAADAVVPQHLVVGRRGARGRGSRATARRSSSRDHRARRLPARGRARPGRRARPRRCSARTRRTRRASSARDATTPYPKDGINDHVVSGAATVNPDGVGTKAALRYRVTVPAGGTAELRLRLHRPDGDAGRRGDWAGDGVRRGRRRARGRRRRVLRRARARRHRRRARCGCCARPAPGWSGASRCTRTTCAAGSTATRASRRRRAAHRTAATATGGTSTPSTCWRCRTRGSTRGSPPGTSASTASRGRTSTPRSRSTSCSCCCASGSSTRTARCRPTSGTSTTSTRRCTCWPRCGCS